jgi:hypothetical protein
MTRNTRTMLSLAGLLTIALPLAACEEEGGPMAVYDIEPRTGVTAGEQAVRITGANFRQDIGYTVYFGAQRATQVTIMDTTTLLVGTPQHDVGPVDVVVAADDGPAFRIHEAFNFNDQGGTVGEHQGTGAGGAERY